MGFEINISYQCKQDIVHFIQLNDNVLALDALQKYRLFTLYNNALMELMRLMMHSHKRFIRAILAEKDFRVDVQENIALMEIKSNPSLQRQHNSNSAKTKNKNVIMQTLMNRLSNTSNHNNNKKLRLVDGISMSEPVPTHQNNQKG